MIPAYEGMPRWHTASAQGPRNINADGVGAFAPQAARGVSFALADGVGDVAASATAARVAAAAAARSPVADGPVAAVLAAQRAVRELGGPADCVLVVALPRAHAVGYDVAWVGDARAWSWDGESLTQVTSDHTLAQYFRDRGQPVTAAMEHMVTTSVRTARPVEIGTAVVGTSGLVLTSDGVHKPLTTAAMRAVIAGSDAGAVTLVETAIATGGTDNATAIVVEPAPSEPTTAPAPIGPAEPPTERLILAA